MIVEGSIVTGKIDSEDSNLIMGIFLVTEVDGDDVYMRCVSHEGDEDNVGEDFEAFIYELDTVTLIKPITKSSYSTMGAGNTNNGVNLQETDLMALGLI